MPHHIRRFRPCRYPDCPHGSFMLGYCRQHYAQMYAGLPLSPLLVQKNGTHRKHGLTLQEVAEYIERERVTKLSNGCWEWQGYKEPSGHGQIRFNGKLYLVSRLMLMARGEVPPDKLVCHRCNNSSCVRPSHLYVGTHADNTRDAVLAGRQYPRRRLTLEQAQEIRQRYAAGGIKQSDLAAEYGYTQGAIGKIIRGDQYKY